MFCKRSNLVVRLRAFAASTMAAAHCLPQLKDAMMGFRDYKLGFRVFLPRDPAAL